MATEVKRHTSSTDRVALVVLASGYIVLRALNAASLWIASRSQAASGPPNPEGSPSTYFVHTQTPASPGLGGVLTNWDGQWYERIAVDGYPSAAEAHSANDAWSWAFPPGFPLAVRSAMALTGAGFTPTAVAVNLLLGATATVLVYLLFKPAVGSMKAVIAGLLINAFPSAPLFMLSLSEPLALVLLLGCLLATVHHRHWTAVPMLLALALTRPVAAPFALVVLAHGWAHHRQGDLGRRPAPRIAMALTVLVCLASPWLWGFISASVGRAPVAASSGADRTASIVRRFDFGWFGALERTAGLPALMFFMAVVVIVLWLGTVSVIRLGLPTELAVWGVAYVLFVLLVTPLHPALLRYLLLAAPFLVALPLRLTELRLLPAIALAVTVVGCLLWLQWFWIRYVYILDPAPALLPFAA